MDESKVGPQPEDLNGRRIYRYKQGVCDVMEDPIILDLRMHAAAQRLSPPIGLWDLYGKWVELNRINDSDDPDSAPKIDYNTYLKTLCDLVAVVRDAFRFPELEAGGPTATEAMRCLYDFLEWREKKDASIAASPVGSGATGSGPNPSTARCDTTRGTAFN